jgi:DNA repair exonuclease SbcCD ATPase subunit
LTKIKASHEEQLKQWSEQQRTLDDKIIKKQGIVKECSQRLKDIQARLKEIEVEKAKAYQDFEVDKTHWKGQRKLYQDGAKTARDKKATSQLMLSSARKSLRDLESVPKACPTCNRAWDKAASENEIGVARTLVEKLENDLRSLTEIVQGIEEKETEADDKITKIDWQLKKLGVNAEVIQLRDETADLEADRQDAQEKIATLTGQKNGKGPDDTKVQKQQSVVEERQRALEEAERRITETAAKISEAREAMKVVRYWVKAFSPNGIPNMVLADAIEPLNSTSKRISTMLTGGTIVVSYDTSRALATGAERAELTINVTNTIGSSSIDGASKGESGLTNLIVAETLSSVGNVSNRIGFRWYDEILNSQDPMVRRSILTYLKDLASRLKILIFVVDHHAETSNYADKILMVEKSGEGVTNARWTN